MATKFSQFTTGIAPVDATTFLVGYESVANTNNQYSKSDLATWLTSGAGAITTLYAGDGTIGAARVATITDTPKFEGTQSTNIGLELNNQYNSSMSPSSGGSKLLLSSGTSGVTTLELRANRTGNGGSNASTTFINSSSSLVFDATNTIGWMYKFGTGSIASLAYYGTNSGSTLRISSNGGATPNRIDLGWDGGDSGYIGVVGNTIGLGNNSGGTLTENLTILSGGDVGIGQTSPTEKLEVGGNCKITGQGYTELHDTANTTLTVDWNNSNIQELTGLTGSHTFTASNPKAGATYILTLAQTGAVTATWTGVKWPGGTAPTLSGTGKTDVVTLICYDATGAGLYYGSATLDLA
jgi:hypothetical protein